MVTMSSVWDRTTEFLSDNVGAVAVIAATTLYLPAVVEAIVAPMQGAAQPGGLKFGLSVLSLVLSLIALFGQIALIALALDPARGPGGAFAVARSRFLPMIGVSVVLLVAAFVALLPPVLLLAADGVDLTAMSAATTPNVSPGTALVLFGYLLLLVPVAIWVSARLSIVGSIVVAERRGLGAIAHSWRLTRGLALRIAGAVILLLVVAGVASLAAELVFGSVFRIAFGNEGAVNAAVVLTALFVSVVSAALTVIVTAFLAKLYLAAAARAEAAVPA